MRDDRDDDSLSAGPGGPGGAMSRILSSTVSSLRLSATTVTSSTINASSLHLSTVTFVLDSPHLARHFRNFDIPNPRYPCRAIHSTTDDHEATGKKPPPAYGRPRRIGQEATAAPHRARSHRRAASGKKPPPRCIGQEAATAAPSGSDQPHPNLAPMTFTSILRISPPPISLSFHFSLQLLDWPVGSDSLAAA